MKYALVFVTGAFAGAYVVYRNVWKILYEPTEY